MKDDQYRKMSRVVPVYSVIPFYVCAALLGSYCLMNLLLAVVLQSFSEQKMQRKRARNARVNAARMIRKQRCVPRLNSANLNSNLKSVSVASLPGGECSLPAAESIGTIPPLFDSCSPPQSLQQNKPSRGHKTSSVSSVIRNTAVCLIASLVFLSKAFWLCICIRIGQVRV